MDGSRHKISFGQRVKTYWFLKWLGISAFITIFFIAYLALLKHPMFPVTIMPFTALDRLIGFHPASLVFYCSLWFYVGIPAALQPSLRQLINYGWAVAALCMTGLAIFFFWPTEIPPSNIDWNLYPGFGFLKNIDAAGNACPSLHVATAVYSAIWLNHLLHEMEIHRAARWVNWIWCVAIVYSTMATKQHVAIDAIAGTALGVVGGVLSLQPRVGIAMKPLSA